MRHNLKSLITVLALAVTGAALAYDQAFGAQGALNVATVTKLVRNLGMLVVIPLMAYLHRREEAAAERHSARVNALGLIPLFILGFLALAIVRTVGDATLPSGLAFGLWDAGTWRDLIRTLQTWAVNLLAMAMAGVGLGTSLSQLRGLGLKPFYAGLGAAVAVGVVSLLGIAVLSALGLR